MMCNRDIRMAAARAGVRLWQIAEVLGVADCSLSRKLRKELPQEQKQLIRDIIGNLKEGEVHD